MNRLSVSGFRNAHKGQTAILLGNGPTLAQYDKRDLALLSAQGDKNGTNLIGINKSYTQVWSRYHCFVASDMWNLLAAGKFKPDCIFTLSKYLDIPSKESEAIKEMELDVVTMPALEHCWMLKKRFVPWLDKGTEATFGGIFAAQIAAWMGHSTIYLVAYDCHNNEGHHCDNHAIAKRSNMLGYFYSFSKWAQHEGVKVYNCNPDSAIKDFPYKDIPVQHEKGS